MQYLLLARHGNTFAPGQQAVWVGAQNDLPLVESGIAQAQSLAQALQQASITPQAIYSASLKRTSVYAQIIHDQLQPAMPINIDERLNEIDYGLWTGLSNDEIKMQYGTAELDEWNHLGKWPQSFSGTEIDMESEVNSFVQEVVAEQPDKKLVLAVSSNGRLKYFLKLIPAIFSEYMAESKWKVSTGNMCILGYTYEEWQLISWNENPKFACSRLSKI